MHVIEYEGYKKCFRDKVDQYCEERNISLDYVAYYSETSYGTFKDYINGLRLPRLTTLIMVAELLGCTVNELLGFPPIDLPPASRSYSPAIDDKRMMMNISEQIKERSKSLDETVHQACTICGRGMYTLHSKIDKCDKFDTFEVLAFSKALHCTPSDLLGY
jgi:transcriptional regulator with XRE-family HTH domain